MKKPAGSRLNLQLAMLAIAVIGLVGYYAIEAADYARAGFVLLREMRAQMVAAVVADSTTEEGE